MMKEEITEDCPLCGDPSENFHEGEFFLCQTCEGIFRTKRSHPTRSEEKARYRTHENDVNDPAYQNFVSPITDAVKSNISQDQRGLDFGAGTGPVISKVLEDAGYDIKQYDPFFHDNLELLEGRYDYIVCCEVIEHFHDPYKEFKKLNELLLPGGYLFCMTNLYRDGVDFGGWGYKNDFTHTFFYQKETFRWIRKEFEFSDMNIENRLIMLVK